MCGPAASGKSNSTLNPDSTAHPVAQLVSHMNGHDGCKRHCTKPSPSLGQWHILETTEANMRAPLQRSLYVMLTGVFPFSRPTDEVCTRWQRPTGFHASNVSTMAGSMSDVYDPYQPCIS